jgi:hypothetical protein
MKYIHIIFILFSIVGVVSFFDLLLYPRYRVNSVYTVTVNKNATSIIQQNIAQEVASSLSTTLYSSKWQDILLRNIPTTRDSFLAVSEEKRRKKWLETISIKTGEGNAVTFSVKSSYPGDALALSLNLQSELQSLLQQSVGYYEHISITLVSGPTLLSVSLSEIIYYSLQRVLLAILSVLAVLITYFIVVELKKIDKKIVI